ncbi:hypothetical protein RRF57_002387 [Xylaria bambusicola]|uniref:Uncharacterized protein n=1 Tax=Xylaria bambusicola TaxID=326684 RepID=A0AAN7Z1R1_9PEZI
MKRCVDQAASNPRPRQAPESNKQLLRTNASTTDRPPAMSMRSSRRLLVTIIVATTIFLLFGLHHRETLIRPLNRDEISQADPEQQPELQRPEHENASSNPTSAVIVQPSSKGTGASESSIKGGEMAPSKSDHDLELVVASVKAEDKTWFHRYLPTWHKNIYVADDPLAPLTVPRNKGREAMVYLTYIIDRYDSLPHATLFVHASRFAWHNDDPDYDALPTLLHFRLPYLREQGYVNLRCVWTIGCPAEIRPEADEQAKNTAEKIQAKHIYKEAFEELFPGVEVPEMVAVSCCSQFAVTRDTIRSRTKEEYVRYREWLLNTELDDALNGRVFEFAWHIIFGKEAVHCPSPADCYCNVFGLCDLSVCRNDGCEGRYVLPPYSTLPNGWPLVGWEQEERNFTGPL